MSRFSYFSSDEKKLSERLGSSCSRGGQTSYYSTAPPQNESLLPQQHPENYASKTTAPEQMKIVDAPKAAGSNNIAAQTFTFRELATATKNFRQECLIGEGGFGRVYKGKLEKTGQAQPVFKDPSRFPELADPVLNGEFAIRALNQAVAVAAMCLQEEAAVRPLISDVVTVLSFLGNGPDANMVGSCYSDQNPTYDDEEDSRKERQRVNDTDICQSRG
ncbi:hypothetical protein COLO4_34245 [Corchorus olitorius]|uniref:Protein kinase domain-containing protein n=1 Tax=Corchorus olitorius TaxID=93759 RepID=A0A1R3GMK0_9ROSI|nr:hypothetical protein COLO4_34245 [Corchorus olitorius]